MSNIKDSLITDMIYQMLGCGISCNSIGWHKKSGVWQVYDTDSKKNRQ